MENENQNKINISKILLIIAIAFVVILLGIVIWYNIGLSSVKKGEIAEETFIKVIIEEGMGASSISELLEENNVIRSATVMKLYTKLHKVNSLKAGVYKFDNSENLKEIIAHLENGDIAYDEVRITFIEGKNMRSIAKTIAENTTNTEQDVFNLLEDEEYIDSLIEKYWFLTDEIKQDDIYYPLEGYLLPDTYAFENEDVSVETIFNVLLNYMDKFLTEYKDKMPNNLTVHQTLTMASLAELEGKSLEDRQEIVGVFFNRVYNGMSLGSDVSTYYAFKVDMGERDLTVKELNTENPYNTRGPNMIGKIPIGPICNPSKSAIEATITYKETNAFYFVADKNGKVYFTRNNNEHLRMIKSLKNQGLWYVYE